LDPVACRIRGTLQLSDECASRWDTLSHGERKRVQVGFALWRDPAILALDEPTNHLDLEARERLLRALKGYTGVGILVTHDRMLLDGLCSQCVFVQAGQAELRSGGYTAAAAQRRADLESARREWSLAREQVKRLEREVSRRKSEASGANHKRSKRRLRRRDSDAREKIDRARVTGKDGAAGRRVRQLEGRLEAAQKTQLAGRVQGERRLVFWLPADRARSDTLFRMEPGSLALGPERALDYPLLQMAPADRIALIGPNGSGKSTLLRYLTARIPLDRDRLVYVPQEVSAAQARRVVESVRRLPGSELGHLLTVVSGLGSEAARLLETLRPSPGETRKLMLALGVTRRPYLIVMDEPTNHLDLPSIELLERALKDCPCALLLVSHDRQFLDHTTSTRWRIEADAEDRCVLRIEAG
jgi:ATPase subunit of ABC transporter with duplicated ATPase domains